MATKTVALDVEAYELLKRQKARDESFSDTVKRLARPHRPLTDFAGIWSDLSSKERRELAEVYANLRDADTRRADRIRKSWGSK